MKLVVQAVRGGDVTDRKLRDLERAAATGDAEDVRRLRRAQRRAGLLLFTTLYASESGSKLLFDLVERRTTEGLDGRMRGARQVYEYTLDRCPIIPKTAVLFAGDMATWELGREGFVVAKDNGRGMLLDCPRGRPSGVPNYLGCSWLRGSVDYRTGVVLLELEQFSDPAWRPDPTRRWVWATWAHELLTDE